MLYVHYVVSNNIKQICLFHFVAYFNLIDIKPGLDKTWFFCPGFQNVIFWIAFEPANMVWLDIISLHET